jgi:hypothetical protein
MPVQIISDASKQSLVTQKRHVMTSNEDQMAWRLGNVLPIEGIDF